MMIKPRIHITTICAATLAQMLMSASTVRSQQTGDFLPYGDIPTPQAELKYDVKPRTLELIDQALKSGIDLPRRIALVGDLGLCPVPQSAEILKNLLKDHEPLMRAAALRALVAINAADPQIMAAMMKDTSAIVRSELVQAGFAEAILAGINDPDPGLQAMSLGKSVNSQTDLAIANRIKALSPPLQALALRTLGDRKADSKPYAPQIAALLTTEPIVPRIAAIDALAAIGAIDASQIQTQVRHPHSAVRVAAMRAATILSPSDQVAVAKIGLADKDLSVRTAAAALAIESDASFVPILLAQLNEDYHPLRLAARQALVRCALANPQSKTEVISAAGKLLKHEKADRRIDGSFILGSELRSKEELAAHIALLDDADWHVIHQAAMSLGPIGDVSAGEKLVATALRAIDLDPKKQYDHDELETRFSTAEKAVLSALVFKYQPLVAATRKFYLNKGSPINFRMASVYAAGLMAPPDQVVSDLRPILTRANDPEESPAVIHEAIKAMGNARAKTAAGPLRQMGSSDAGTAFAYIIHLSLNRINGTDTTFTQAPMIREPATSIRALDPR